MPRFTNDLCPKATLVLRYALAFSSGSFEETRLWLRPPLHSSPHALSPGVCCVTLRFIHQSVQNAVFVGFSWVLASNELMKTRNLRLNGTNLYKLKLFILSLIQMCSSTLKANFKSKTFTSAAAWHYMWHLSTNGFFSYRFVISRASPRHWSWTQLFLLLKPLSCVLCLIRLMLFICRCNSKPSWCYASLLPKAPLWWHIPQFEPNARRQHEADVGDEGLEWSKFLHCWQPVANSPPVTLD